MKIHFKQTFLLSLVLGTFGCSNPDDRTITREEVKAADARREAAIATLDVPADVKARMRTDWGGPPPAGVRPSGRDSPP